MHRIGKRFSFSASHFIGGLPADHPCARLHGHNYDVEVVLRQAQAEDGNGILIAPQPPAQVGRRGDLVHRRRARGGEDRETDLVLRLRQSCAPA